MLRTLACVMLFAISVPAAAALQCPFRVPPAATPGLESRADLAIAAWRAALKLRKDDPQVRQAMADYAINLLSRVNHLDAIGREQEAQRLRRYVLSRLPDTDWRLQHQAQQGDLGSIEARLAWLRADPVTNADALCALARRGAALGGAESLYRKALCTTDPTQALGDMQRAAALGQAAALEAVGRLCLSGRLASGCRLEGLCLAAQAGRLGAASAIGWQLTAAGTNAKGDGAAWLGHAAAAGDALAQNNLGEWEERHAPGQHGRLLALAWYRRAADQGLPAAMVNAARLLAEGTPAQCLEAQGLLEAAERGGLTQARQWRAELRCKGDSEGDVSVNSPGN